MKTLLLTDSFLPHAGGSRVYYFNLYSRLAQDFGEGVTVLTRRLPGDREFDRQVPQGMTIRRFGKRSVHVRPSQYPKLVPYFAHTLAAWAAGRGEIIHTGDLFPAGICGGALHRMARVPYVTYCHGEEIIQTQGYRYQPKVRDWVYRGAAVVIANSSFTKRKLLEVGVPEEKVHVITPGVDWRQFNLGDKENELIREFGLDGKVVLLTVGRLVPRKGHEAVLAALARLPDRAGVRYIIAGTGSEELKLKALAGTLGVSDSVLFTGYFAKERLPKLFQACDIFVMPNHQPRGTDIEGFGMVFLEANAAGKPVIAGNSGGAVDAVQDGVTGFLVDSREPDQLLQRLQQLINDRELRRRLGDAGRNRACKDFDWDSRAAALHEINRNILDPGNRVEFRRRKIEAASRRHA